MINPKQSSSICDALTTKQEALFASVDEKVFNAFPDIQQRFGMAGVERTREDIRFHIDYLRSAVCMGEKSLFLDYVGWLKMYFTSIRLPKEYILPPLKMLADSVKELFEPPEAKTIVDYIDHAIDSYDKLPAGQNTFISDSNQLNVLANQYLNALLRRDRATAEELIVEKLRKGTQVRDIYLNVFQPVQWEVGRLWQENTISVAMEHYMTAATQVIMSRLYEFIFSAERIGRSMVATSVSGELHELGIRMVADFFEMAGWNTYYLGANTPHESILKMIRETDAEMLAISATIPFNLPKVESLIAFIRKEIPPSELKIIVGGKPFNAAQELWKKVGADGFASDAEQAIKEINRLTRLN